MTTAIKVGDSIYKGMVLLQVGYSSMLVHPDDLPDLIATAEKYLEKTKKKD